MKSKNILAFLIITIMLLNVVPRAHANLVSISAITPSSGIAGTRLLGGMIDATRVTVTGQTAEANDIVQILWDHAALLATSNCPNTCTSKTLADKSYTIMFDVPLATHGNHDVTADNLNVTGLSTTIKFAVNTVIELSRTSGPVGSTVQIFGSGFAATSSSTIAYDTSPVGSGATDSRGSLVSASDNTITFQTFSVPDSVHGMHGVTVSDLQSNQASKGFSVVRNVQITGETDPAVPPPTQTFPVVGSTIHGRATGFSSLDNVTLWFSGTTIPTGASRFINLLTANAKGTVVFDDTIPRTAQLATGGPPASTFNYVANDTLLIGAGAVCQDASGCASRSTSLNPLLTLTPDHSAFGQQVNALGEGFSAKSGISVTVTPQGSTTPVATLLHAGVTNSTGTFTLSFVFSELTSPSLPAGKYIVTATDGNHFTDSRRFFLGTQVIPTPDHGIATDHSMNIHGTVVTIDGFVYTPNSTVTITFDGTQVGTPTADQNGDFTTTITVPEALGGFLPDRITATDNAKTSRTASAGFTVDSWIKISPEHGRVGNTVTIWGSGFPATATSVQVHYCGLNGATDALSPDINAGSACPTISIVPVDANFRQQSPTAWTVFTTGDTTTTGTTIRTPALNALGSFSATFPVPESWGGFHSVFTNALDGSGAIVPTSTNGALFRVQLSISTNPTSAQKDRQVTLQGSGFFQWEKYITQAAGSVPVTFTEQAFLVVDFGPTLRYIDQANFILNGQFDTAWSFGLYHPVALNERGSIVNAGFQGLVSPGSQFIKVPSLEPDQYSLSAYYFKMSSPRYSTEETATSSFTVNSPEITTINHHTDSAIDTKITPMLNTIKANVDSVLTVTGNIITDIDNNVKPLITGVTHDVNLHVDSATAEVTSAVNTNVDAMTAGVTHDVNVNTNTVRDSINTHVDTMTAGVTHDVNSHVDSATSTVTSSVNSHVDSATAGVTSAVNSVGSNVSNLQGSVNTAAQGVSSLQNNLPATVQNPLGILIAILAAIAAIGSIGAVVITSRRLKVAA